MPGYLLHLTEAEMILDQESFKFNNDEKKLFALGTVLPDAVNRNEKLITHFWNDETIKKFYRLPDMASFVEKYERELKNYNPVIMGVYAHLALDHGFYHDFWPSILEPVGVDGEFRNVWDNQLFIYMKESGEMYTKDEFFSNDVLYGDYTRLNPYLIKKYNPYIPNLKDLDLFKKHAKVFDEVGIDKIEPMLKEIHKYIYQEKNSSKLLVFNNGTYLEEYLAQQSIYFI